MAAVQLEMVSLDAFIRETRALPDDVDWVVWPEYAVPYDVRRMAKDWKLITDLVAERGITLTFGTQVQEENGWRNVALTLDATGELGEHTKVHTVHLFDDGTPGRDAGVFATAFGKVGTPICFDCDYEGVVRRMTAAGADFIISPVMDATSWSARQHDQHAELFRIRACENRRWVFVAASSGISQVIDPWGRVHGRLGALEQGVLTGEIHAADGLTFYTRHGWRLPWLVLAGAAACWMFLLVGAWRLQTAATEG
jgi:apolipoprotein N-acyltransferase